jgi:glutamate-1-semialdehyde 2,1-aminomutase
MFEKLLLVRRFEHKALQGPYMADTKDEIVPLMPTVPETRDFSESDALRPKAHRLIPGGAHTYAKGDDQYPEQSPGFIARGKGCHVWDLDGNEFIEYGMGLRAVTLGHAFGPVVEAAYKQMQLGTNFSRPAKVEVGLAEAMLEIIDGAEMVKFAKNGSDVTTSAVKLARAYTGRNRVAICGDQPFFSIDDWFIGTTEINAGIPQAITEMTLKFRYNDIESLRVLFDQYPGQIACVVLEAEASIPPRAGYLNQVKDLCEQLTCLLLVKRWAMASRSRHLWASGRLCDSVVWSTTKPEFSCYPRRTAARPTLWRRRSKP